MCADRDTKKIWRGAALVFSLALVSLLVFQFILAKDVSVKKNCESVELAMFRTQLALVPSSDVQMKGNVEGKIRAWETMIAICESRPFASVNPSVKPQFTPWTPPPFETGIFEGQTGHFHAFEAMIENHWIGIVNGNRVTVFAGSWTNDPSLGFIAVETAPSKGHSIWGYYPSPTKSGALRILEAKRLRLSIQQAGDSTLLYFDVPALMYVSSFDAVVTPVTATAIPATAQPLFPPYPPP